MSASKWAVFGPNGIKEHSIRDSKQEAIDAFRKAATMFMPAAIPAFSFYESMGYYVAVLPRDPATEAKGESE